MHTTGRVTLYQPGNHDNLDRSRCVHAMDGQLPEAEPTASDRQRSWCLRRRL